MQTATAPGPSTQAVRRAIEGLTAHQRERITFDGVHRNAHITFVRPATVAALTGRGITDGWAYTTLGAAVAAELARQARATSPTAPNAVLTEDIDRGDDLVPAGTLVYAERTGDHTVRVWTVLAQPYPSHDLAADTVRFDA